MDEHDVSPPVGTQPPSLRVLNGNPWWQFITKLPKWALAVGCTVLVLLVTTVDFFTGSQISLLVFYLVPIGLAAWFGSRSMGLLQAILAAAGWIFVELIDIIQLHPLVFFWDALMRVSVFLLLAYLLSTLRARLLEVSIQARTDPLTGIFNRRFLYERMEGELLRARRHHRPLSLISIDVDDFKQINDRYGHAGGDEVLLAVSEVLRGSTREIDVAARTGGDEFVVLLSETNSAAARDVVDKLMEALRSHMRAIRRDVTFSFGVATFSTPPASVDEMFRLVDTQLYSAKHLGKNRIAQIETP